MGEVDVFKSLLTKEGLIENIAELPQVDCPVTNYFANGQYVRETFMPAGTFVMGKKHKYSTVNIMLKGSMSLYNGEGATVVHIKAPYIWVSEAGVQKMAYFHEDSICVNAHPTEETDLDKIESEFIEIDIKEIE